MPLQPLILFADDDLDTCEMVALTLRQAGFRVSVTDQSSDVLRLWRLNQFDALVLDNWMPGTTGLEICRQIRTFDKDTPIIIWSGAVEVSDVADARAAGAQGYIQKPCDPDLLIEALRSALKSFKRSKAA